MAVSSQLPLTPIKFLPSLCNIYKDPVDIFGTVVGESPDCLLLSGTVVSENTDYLCWGAHQPTNWHHPTKR